MTTVRLAAMRLQEGQRGPGNPGGEPQPRSRLPLSSRPASARPCETDEKGYPDTCCDDPQAFFRHPVVSASRLAKHEGGKQQHHEKPKDDPEPGRGRAPASLAAWRQNVQRLPVLRAWVSRVEQLRPPHEVQDEDDEQNNHEDSDHSIACPCDREHVFLLRRLQAAVSRCNRDVKP